MQRRTNNTDKNTSLSTHIGPCAAMISEEFVIGLMLKSRKKSYDVVTYIRKLLGFDSCTSTHNSGRTVSALERYEAMIHFSHEMATAAE